MLTVGDLVQTIPDTAPGIYPCRSVAITGHIKELKSDDVWFYNISYIHHSKNTLWIPEHRVRPISKSIFDDCYVEHSSQMRERELRNGSTVLLKLIPRSQRSKFSFFFSHFYLFPLYLRSSEGPSFWTPLIQADIFQRGIIR